MCNTLDERADARRRLEDEVRNYLALRIDGLSQLSVRGELTEYDKGRLSAFLQVADTAFTRPQFRPRRWRDTGEPSCGHTPGFWSAEGTEHQ